MGPHIGLLTDMRSFVLLTLVIATFVLPLRLAGRGTRAVVSAYALVMVYFVVMMRLVIQHL